MSTTKQRFGKEFYFLILVQTFTSGAFYTTAPILTKYLIGGGMTVALAGTVSGLISLTALVVRPFSGALADRIDPKKILMISIPLLAISTFGYSITTAAVPIFLFRILNGVAFCLNGTTTIAFSCRFIPRERMSEGIGYQGLGNVLASSVCPGIGLGIYRSMGATPTFAAGALMALVGLLILLPVKSPKQETTVAGEELSKRGGFRLENIIAVSVLPIALLAGVFSYCNGTVTNFLVLVTEENGVLEISMYYTVIAITMVVLRTFVGRLCDKHGTGIILIPAYVLTAAGVWLMSHTHSAAVIVAVGVLMAFGQGGGSPALLSEAVRKVDVSRSGVATGTYYIFLDVFQGISPIVGGLLVERFATYRAPFDLACGLLIFGLVLYLLIAKRVFVRKEG